MTIDVPEGVGNPTAHGVHLGNMLLELDFTGEHVMDRTTAAYWGPFYDIHTNDGIDDWVASTVELERLDKAAYTDGYSVVTTVHSRLQDAAQAALRQAQSLDPDNPLVRVELAESLDRGMVMGDIRLVSKEGGASGSWTREKEG